jgi:hypothetical protein
MAVTATRLMETNLGPYGKMAVYNVPLGAAWTGAGETCDLTDDFERIYFATIQPDTAAGSAAVSLDLIVPAVGTDLTATNVLVTAKRCLTAGAPGAGAFDNCNGADLSGIATTRLLVVGKPVAGGTW